jgi:hypothetical protein
LHPLPTIAFTSAASVTILDTAGKLDALDRTALRATISEPIRKASTPPAATASFA